MSNVDEEIFKHVETAIKKNPPIHPDLKRNLEYYTTNFLWIKLEFKGANITNKTIKIPTHVLPIDSDELRKKLTSNIKLFENLEKFPWYYKLKKINNDEKELRKKFLHPIREKNGMNIIAKSDFVSFQKDLDKIKLNIEIVTNEITKSIDKEIDNTKSKFRQVLFEFYKRNYTKYFSKYQGENVETEAGEYVNYLMSEIHFFGAAELLTNFQISYFDYELTTSDLANERLIIELKEKNILCDEKVNQLEIRGKGFHSTNL